MRSLAWNKEKNEMDSELLRERIFGGHIAEYQKMLIREDCLPPGGSYLRLVVRARDQRAWG